MKIDPQQHVKTILKECLNVYPPNGKKHNKFFKNLVDNGDIPEKMAKIIIKIIEDPNCNYKVKADGTLKIDNI
tara:strand:- start:152 stop:370 length:219 start_codon:yes stop_codon:yes gene_type:complete